MICVHGIRRCPVRGQRIGGLPPIGHVELAHPESDRRCLDEAHDAVHEAQCEHQHADSGHHGGERPQEGPYHYPIVSVVIDPHARELRNGASHAGGNDYAEHDREG